MPAVLEKLFCPPLGLKLHWQEQELLRLELFFPQLNSDFIPALSQEGKLVWEFLYGYVRGAAPDPPQIRLAWHSVSRFSRLVLGRLQDSVGYGQHISYSGLADLCQRPGAARAVGRVMAKNPWPLLVPCHRVLGKNIDLVGFSSGLELKRFLLDLEGIAYKGSGPGGALRLDSG